MEKNGMPTKGVLINCPACPIHPKPVIGTLAYVAAKGYPEADPELQTPKMFYGHSTHDQCPRYHYYERKIFAQYLGDPNGCLFKLGCLGPLTHTECPHRQWNTGVNWCIRASAPCIGCSSQYFAKKKDFPFYRKSETVRAVAYKESDRNGGAK
jgi:hydrogenase small subunit